MNNGLEFTLSFEGNESEDHFIDFYDVAQALMGFQRSLALTTHLVLNNEIITQSPSLKGARIYAIPPEVGSWKMTAVISMMGVGVYNFGTLQNNSPLGHLVYSLYDYVVSESLGSHVDYNKSLGQLYEDAKKKKLEVKVVSQSQADSLVEKCATAIQEIHRPIYKTQTATTAQISGLIDGENRPLSTQFNLETFGFLNETRMDETPVRLAGKVSSYNSNTYKGRVYVAEYGRPVAFDLTNAAKGGAEVKLITASLAANALNDHNNEFSTLYFTAFRNTSISGVLKSLTISKVSAK